MRLFSVLRSRTINPGTMGPVKHRLNDAKATLKIMPNTKQWLCSGYRSAAIAAELLRNGKIVALPTDTIYGLAGLAQDDRSITRLYEIKERDPNKPLAICLCNIEDIEKWAHIEDLPKGLTEALLPGPVTLVLRRKGSLNPALNPGVVNIGVRIPQFDFVRSVVKMLNQPIALTSANKSGERSTLHPNEFEDLWPELDGVFYEKMTLNNARNSWRRGSTVVDLSVKGEFKILRRGIGFSATKKILKYFHLTNPRAKQNKNEETNETSDEEADVSAEEKASASG